MNTTQLKPASAKPWWRQLWPWLLIAGPAIVVVAGIWTAWVAISGADPVIRDGHGHSANGG